MGTFQKITPFLWFDDQAEAAAAFYVGIFGNARILGVTHYGSGGPRPEGSVLTVAFELEGQRFVALNGGPEFTFTEAISLAVSCETQAEIDRLWARLCEGGREGECGWLKDRFGLSWQVVPAALLGMLEDPDRARVDRVLNAIMGMRKLDIADLERAYAGDPASGTGIAGSGEAR